MADYTVTTDFSTKDALASGDPEKLIIGSDVDTEFDAIAVAIASKPDQGEVQANTFTFYTAAGTDTYTATPVPAIASYAAGQGFQLLFTNANTGAATINLNSLGAQSIVLPNGDPLSSGDITASMVAWLVYDGTDFILMGGTASTAKFPRGHIDGLILSRDSGDTSNDTNITAGEADNQDRDRKIILGSEVTKRIDASWAAGDDAGGFPTGLTLTGSVWYHIFVIMNPTSGVVDAGYDTYLTATNLLSDASGYTEYRRVGAVLRNSGNTAVLGYTQIGNWFQWDDPPADVDVTEDATANTRAISTPLGVQCLANLNVFAQDVSNLVMGVYVSSLDANDEAVSLTVSPFGSVYGASGPLAGQTHYMAVNMRVWTDTSSQIRTRADQSLTLRIATLGWMDLRGKE